jgi:glycosyltransferase involved in cell wall biosynthesis
VLQGEAALVTAALRASADAGPFDLLHAHGWAGAAAAHSLRRVLRLPLVFTLHRLEHLEPESYQPQELAYIQELLAWICQQAERVICSSRFAVAEAIRVHGLPPQKVNLSPAAVDPNEWQTDADLAAFRQLFGVEGGRLITFAGRLTHAKGPQVLLEAFPHILAVAPDARMAIAGEGPLGPWLLRRAQELGVGSEVTCTGYLRGKVLATLLCASDVCVLPSLMEASGQGAAEAMGGGIPVVASVTGGLPELIAQEEDGLLVPPGDVKALAAAIVRVLYDRELRTRLAINGRRRILAGHAWPTVVDSVLHSYAAAQQGRAVPCEGR